jgi:low affinity Fe/Cu permease
MTECIKSLCAVLVLIWVAIAAVLTPMVAFSPDWVCRNTAIAPIDYIMPFRIAGCWLGDMPMKSREQGQIERDRVK